MIRKEYNSSHDHVYLAVTYIDLPVYVDKFIICVKGVGYLKFLSAVFPMSFSLCQKLKADTRTVL